MQITDLVYIDTTGYHFADFPSFLTWIQDQYRGIYGADVYLEADSQDGQFLAILAQAFYDTASLGASVFNSFSPVTAQGVGLSRNVKINGISRRTPSRSTVDVLCVGQTGITVTGGVIIDTLKQKWDVPTFTFPDAGEITVTAVSQVDGAVQAESDTVNQIFTPTLGWQTVNNDAAATPGAPVESDAELRARQALSVANPSLTVLDGTVGGVGNLDGVTKVRGYENDTEITDANSIPAHSISICVVGGDSQEIADEIGLHKTPGTGTYGNTSETVYDAHGMPLTIAFNRAVTATIQCTVTIATNVAWSSDYESLLIDAIAASINAGKIGDPILYTKLFGVAYLPGTPASGSFDVASIELGKNSGMQSAANVTLTYRENPVCDPTVDVTVVIT